MRMSLDDIPYVVDSPTAAPITPESAATMTSKSGGGSDGDEGSPQLPSDLKLEGQDLLDALRKQVEFYFSRQNLQTDGFLVSQMNAQMCVPISVIAQFHKIQQLTSNTSLIAESVKNSTVCTVTPDGIKPSIKQERNTIILREIPSETSQEKVREIFSGDGIAPIKSIRSDVGDTWFVTMQSEDDALSTILALRSKSFEGKAIKARLKSENILRSFFPVPTAADVQPTAAAAASAPFGMGAGSGTSASGMQGVPYAMPGMNAPMMNGQPSYSFMGPGAGRGGMYGRGGVMMTGPGNMRFGGMQQGMSGGGRGCLMQQRGAGGPTTQMVGLHQGRGMGQQMGISMNPKMSHQQQQQPQQLQAQQQQQRQQHPDGRRDRKRDGMQGERHGGSGGERASIASGGMGHQAFSGQRHGEGRGGGDRTRKGDRHIAQGRNEHGRSGVGSKARSAGGRDMLSAANFPPLPGAELLSGSGPGSSGAGLSSTDGEDKSSRSNVAVESVTDESRGTLASTSSETGPHGYGYPGPFVQYQQDEILKIVSSLSQTDVVDVPGVADIREHALVFDKEANLGLLMRQRSVSIDECREQLRKGRPVHREGVIAGEVDYDSYMYGEGHEQGQSNPSSAHSSGHPRGQQGNGEVKQGNASSTGTAVDRRRGERGRRDRNDRSVGTSGDDRPRRVEGRAEDKNGRGNRGGKGTASAQEPMGAYAAALLKNPRPNPPAVTNQPTGKSAGKKDKKADSEGKPSGGASSSAPAHGGSGPSKDASSSTVLKGREASSKEKDVKPTTSGDQPAPSRPSRGWEKPEVTQQQQYQQPSKGRGNADVSRVTKSKGTPAGGNETKLSSSTPTTSSGSASSDEGVDAAAALSKEPSRDSEGGNNSTAAPPTKDRSHREGAGASVGKWGGKKSFLDVVKAPGHPPTPTSKPAAPQPNKRAEGLKAKSPLRGRPEPPSSDRSPHRGRHGDMKDRESRLSNGRSSGGGGGGGIRDKGGW